MVGARSATGESECERERKGGEREQTERIKCKIIIDTADATTTGTAINNIIILHRSSNEQLMCLSV